MKYNYKILVSFIHISRYIYSQVMNNNNEECELPLSDDLDKVDSFDSLELKESLLRGIYSYGFERPSDIQQIAIDPIIKGHDLIAQAQSGTGKTGTFSIGLLQKIDETKHYCQAIVVSPTRELAEQINFVILSLSAYLKIGTALCTGGRDIKIAINKLKNGAQVVVGTPGRIINMIEKGLIHTKYIRILVVDEADELLSDSFIPQIKKIVEFIPKESQICLFSATMPYDKFEITKHFLNDPKIILVKKEELSLDGIKQFYIDVLEEDYKFDTLCDLYEKIILNQSMIYVNTKKRANWLKEQLENTKFTVSVIHSSLSPLDRTQIMNSFRNGKTRILISTDLLARGIDVQHVSVVLNYDIPKDKANYIHRIGRSGRFGRKGVAINFVTRRDFRLMKDIESYYKTPIATMPKDIQLYI